MRQTVPGPCRELCMRVPPPHARMRRPLLPPRGGRQRAHRHGGLCGALRAGGQGGGALLLRARGAGGACGAGRARGTGGHVACGAHGGTHHARAGPPMRPRGMWRPLGATPICPCMVLAPVWWPQGPWLQQEQEERHMLSSGALRMLDATRHGSGRLGYKKQGVLRHAVQRVPLLRSE